MYGKWLFKEIKTEYGHCRVEVFRKGYTASAIEIGALVGNSLNLALENLDTITAPIGKSVCSFEICDTEQFEYDDLFTPDATAYKVVVSTKVGNGAYTTRWSGYITPDFFAENLSFRTPISISARDNIGYLNDVDFDLDVATITVGELIQAAFNRIAEDYPMSLSFVTQKQTAEGILAIDATISTYLLREMSWYEALETILHDLGLQMRWVDNNTIAVLDISQLGENFGIQRFNFVECSGYREILPAWRELSQKQDYGLRENFFEGKMTTKELVFAKTQSLTVPDLGFRQDVRYYKPTNWGVARDIYTTDPSFYNSTFGNRLIFSAVSETYPDTTYLSWSTNVLKSNVPLTVKCKALNSIIYPSGGVTPYPLQLKVYDPFLALGSREGDYLQIGLRMNLFLHTRDNKTYVMNKEWVEDNGTGSGTYINMTLDKVSLDAYNVIEGKGAFPIGSQPQEQELTITANTIPYDGALELRIYGYYVVSYQYADENIQSPNFDKFFTYIDDLTYTFDGNDISSGQESKVQVSELHNIKEDRDYSFGQVPLDCGGINAYAGGLFKANGDELVGFRRNVDGSTYPLLELVGREIIHFNKRNYNKLSGTIKNLAKEPLRFDKVFIYKGRNYLPYACSLDVISNTMNITTMQEVEPYMTQSFVEIKSELVTGGGATVSGGNNTALQYSAEVGNAKRISELNNASESEKKESYIVIDNANWNESKKVPLSEMEGLDAEQVEEYLKANKYAKQDWVKDITDDLEADVANRVLIEDFDKLQEAVDLNYTNLNKATTRISTLEGYFSNGVAKDAAKLGGKQPSHYATASALATTADNLSKLTTRVTAAENNLSAVTGRVDVAEGTIKTHTDSIAKNTANIAANATAISTNATNITKVSNRVTKLEGMWEVDANGNLHTTYNIVVDGGGAFGKGSTSGGGGTSGGLGSVTIKTEGGVEYKSNSNGVVTVPNWITAAALNGYATQSWVDSNFLSKNGGTIAQDNIAFPLIVKGTSAQAGVIFKDASGTNKGAISWENGTGTYIYNYASAAYIGVKDDGTPHYKGNTLIHSGNYANTTDKRYLQLSGGTIKGPLHIDSSSSSSQPLALRSNAADASGACRIQFIDANNAFQGYVMSGWGNLLLAHRSYNQIGVGDSGIWCSSDNGTTKNALIHSGNIGSQYVAGVYDAYNPVMKINFMYGGGGLETNPSWLACWNGYTLTYVSPNVVNVASATKLQTARTIWGQNFDGSANVSGNLHLNQSKLFWHSDANNYYIGSYYDGTTNPILDIKYYGGIRFFTSMAERMRIAVNGNVGFGTDNPEYKVDINGNTRISGTQLVLGNDNGGSILFQRPSANYIWAHKAGGYLVFGCLDQGELGVATSSLVVSKGAVYAGATTSLGTPTYKWNKIYGVDIYADGGWLRTSADNTGLYNSTGDARWYYSVSASSWVSDKALKIGGNIVLTDKTGSSTTSNKLKFTRNTHDDDYWDFGLYAQSTKGLTFFQSSKGVDTDIAYLTGNGDLVVTGGGAFGSDVRYKDIINYTNIDLATIADAPLFTYRWNDREDGKVYLGTTAQYWLDTNFKDAVNISNPKFFHLDYGALAVGIGISVAKEVKGVKTEVEQLRERVNELENELKQYRQWHN